MKAFKGQAPAKINLYLDVLSKMENGYHEVETIMQAVSICDEIELLACMCGNERIIEIEVENASLSSDKSNLVYKGCECFLEYAKIKGAYCKFKIKKLIPIAAGMAGGSADCATSLKLLNEAFGYPLSDEELLNIGASIGADVPFCLSGGTAICRGIGEKIIPIDTDLKLNFVCAIDSSSVSTPLAFSMLDEKFGTNAGPSGDVTAVASALKSKNLNLLSSLLFNKFESVITEKVPSVEKIKKILLENGAIGAMMSGSGPSVFGIFDNDISQRIAYESLKSQNIRAFLCTTL